MRSKTLQVIENIHIQDNLYKLVVPFPYTAKAGQFVMVQKENSKYLLARPISICEVLEEKMILIYQVVGRGTGELATLKAGDNVIITGPIGHGFPVAEYQSGQKIALVGGGVGTAPLVETAKALKAGGINCDAHIGFRSKSMLKEELEAYCDNVLVSTETGEEGCKGFVTGTLACENYDAVFCCGPAPMMKAVVEQSKASGTPVFVSMENRMGCGIGACLVCTCANQQGENMRTCMDGPVFDGLEVNFNA